MPTKRSRPSRSWVLGCGFRDFGLDWAGVQNRRVRLFEPCISKPPETSNQTNGGDASHQGLLAAKFSGTGLLDCPGPWFGDLWLWGYLGPSFVVYPQASKAARAPLTLAGLTLVWRTEARLTFVNAARV